MDIINLRFPMAALFFLLIIGIFYFSTRRLPTYSSKAFTRLYFLMAANIIFEFGTLFCLYTYGEADVPLTYWTHVLFIVTLDLVAYQFFMYLYTQCISRRKTTLEMILTAAPLVTCVIVCLFGKITYYADGTYVFSYGTLPNTIFASIGIYITASVIMLVSHRKKIDRRMKTALSCGILFFVVGSLVQLIEPRLLLSSISGSSLVFFLYLSLENPRENFNPDNDCFNEHAFSQVTAELLKKKKPFFVTTVCLDGLSTIRAKFGQTVYNDFLALIGGSLSHCLKKRNPLVFHTQSNLLTFVLEGTQEEALVFANEAEKRLLETWLCDKVSYTFSAKIFSVECPKYAASSADIHNLTQYFVHENHEIRSAEHILVIIDDEFMAKQERYFKLQAIIRSAIQHDGFDVYYQPIYSTAEKAFVSAEALVRLKDTSLGFVSPEEFIPISEREGSILELGLIVFRKVCKLAATRNLPKLGIKYIEVNLSGVQCMSTDIYEQLKRVMLEFNVDPSFINLEITETAAIDASASLRRNMTLLNSIGCTFSLDDFGTGYSNLSQIVSMPLSLVKLDKSLVWGYFDESNPKLSITTANIITMIKQINLGIVAEGVETAEQAETLASMQVDYLQGYYFSKPIPENDFLTFIGGVPLTANEA